MLSLQACVLQQIHQAGNVMTELFDTCSPTPKSVQAPHIQLRKSVLAAVQQEGCDVPVEVVVLLTAEHVLPSELLGSPLNACWEVQTSS